MTNDGFVAYQVWIVRDCNHTYTALLYTKIRFFNFLSYT